MNKHNFTEYEINFLKNGCNCSCSNKIPKEKFAEMWETFQALLKSEQVIFLMAQLKVMNGRIISNSKCLKRKIRSNKRTFYHWNHNTSLNMLGIGQTYFENIRNHLINNVFISRIHSNVKRMPQWKTKMVIDKNVAEAVKNFLENYAEVHGLPNPGRNVNWITQITYIFTSRN